MDQASGLSAAFPGPVVSGIRGVRALDAAGRFSEPRRIRWADGRFTESPAPGLPAAPAADELDGTGYWLIPGLVDTHVHAAWHAFTEPDRAALGPEATARATADGLARNLAAGITQLRDAGGLTPEALAAVPAGRRPRVQLAVRMLDRAAADAAGGLDAAVEDALAAGARWIKLVATAGVAAPAGTGLDPVFTAAETRDAVRRAERVGAGTMVHAWGGAAIDFAIDAGATSLEHGIFLTDAQAARAAAAGLTFVPTLRIYTLVQRMIVDGALPAAFRARVDEAIAAHPNAVRRARDAGLTIAVGTDSGTPAQHGTARLEFDALVAAGLTPSEALTAATRSGAELLARVAETPQETSGVRGAPGLPGTSGTPGTPGLPGTLAPGAVADAVLLRRDPREPGALSDPAAVVAVLARGVLHDPATLDPQRAHAPIPPREDPK